MPELRCNICKTPVPKSEGLHNCRGCGSAILVEKQPAYGMNFSKHMAAKRARLQKRARRQIR